MIKFNPTAPASALTAKEVSKFTERINGKNASAYLVYSQLSFRMFQTKVACKQNKVKFVEFLDSIDMAKSTGYLYAKVGEALNDNVLTADKDTSKEALSKCIERFIYLTSQGVYKVSLNDFHKFIIGAEAKEVERPSNLLEVKVNSKGEVKVKASAGIDAERIEEIIRLELSKLLGK